jgi:hypothetical protein
MSEARSCGGFAGRKRTLPRTKIARRSATADAGRIRSVDIRLGVPTFSGDTLKFTGVVQDKNEEERTLDIVVTGTNSIGQHLAATVRVALP